ncbi:hypothetical protein EYF80_064416 [Liparis tanakae]|uniref:Uncharacterized protein n=1 Tax=Liparis tanakae TaxID=230148 RepID=A0A4Z2E9S6_9TELE|nr:hypothetical protein EYF80_064416 [Liparis tanakae]
MPETESLSWNIAALHAASQSGEDRGRSRFREGVPAPWRRALPSLLSGSPRGALTSALAATPLARHRHPTLCKRKEKKKKKEPSPMSD